MPLQLLFVIVLFVLFTSFASAINNQKRTHSQIRGRLQELGEPQIDEHIDNINGNSSPTIQHEIPEAGYVVLNGIKRRLEDCKYL